MNEQAFFGNFHFFKEISVKSPISLRKKQFGNFVESKTNSPTDRLPPRRMELAHFRAENGANISLEIWGSRVEEPPKFQLQEYLVYQKT